MRLTAVVLITVICCVFSLAAGSFAGTIESRYATIIYENDEMLREFNSSVRLRGLSYLMGNRTNLTVSDEVKNKIDIISRLFCCPRPVR
jgi:hypothetical protein